MFLFCNNSTHIELGPLSFIQFGGKSVDFRIDILGEEMCSRRIGERRYSTVVLKKDYFF